MSGKYDNLIGECLVDTLLRLDEEHFGQAACHQARNELDVLTDALRARHVKQRRMGSQIAIINYLLFIEHGFKYMLGPRDKSITLTATLQQRRGSCLGLAAVYCGLAEALSIPIHPIMYEGHITAGYTGVVPLQHIEVTRKGALLSDKLVAKMYRTTDGQPLILTRTQFVAVYLSNRAAFVLTMQRKLNEALESLNLATELFPTYAGAWINRGYVLMMLNNKKCACSSVEHALSLNPVSRFRDVAQRLLKVLS